MEKSIDIIMPCRFKPEITKVCIDSVKAYTSIPINWIVIQDGKDPEMAKVLKSLSGIKIYNEEARGWVWAINEGMKYAQSEYVMFLNDDIVATPKWIDKMIYHLEMNKSLGVIGPVTNQISGKQHINFNTKDDYEEVGELIGYCMLFRREVLDKVHKRDGFYLDPIFGMGGQEDSDICWRIKNLGYKVAIARNVFIYHYGSKAFRELFNTQESQSYSQSRVDLLRKKWNIPAKKPKPKILIAIPSSEGNIVIPLLHNLVAWHLDDRYEVTLFTPMNYFPLDSARNHIVKEFLQGNYDYLWFIDDDIVPPVGALHKLISDDKDIIGAVAFSMKGEKGLDFPYPVTLRYNRDKEYVLFVPNPGNGIHEVDATGGACIMFKRHVFEHEIMETPYQFKYHRDGTLSLTCDFVVLQKAQSAGFKIYVDFDILCSHLRTVDIKSINDILVTK